jgi:tetrahydromethanopterin S-methyltransferase subunit G
MDPLSITASVITVAALAGQCAKSFSKLRDAYKSLPGRLHALNNEVTDINAVLTDVAALLAERGKHSILYEEQSQLPRIMTQITEKLTELKSIIDVLVNSCAQTSIPIVQARAWSKVQERLSNIQKDIKNAKSRLNVLLGASNSRDLLHIRLQVEAISAQTFISPQFEHDLKQDVLRIVTEHSDQVASSLDEVNRTVDERLANIEKRHAKQVSHTTAARQHHDATPRSRPQHV